MDLLRHANTIDDDDDNNKNDYDESNDDDAIITMTTMIMMMMIIIIIIATTTMVVTYLLLFYVAQVDTKRYNHSAVQCQIYTQMHNTKGQISTKVDNHIGTVVKTKADVSFRLFDS